MHNRRSVFRDNPDPNDPEFFEKIMAVIQALAVDGVQLELVSDETSNLTHLHQITWQSVDEELQTELAIVRDLHDEVCYATIKSKQSWISRHANYSIRRSTVTRSMSSSNNARSVSLMRAS